MTEENEPVAENQMFSVGEDVREDFSLSSAPLPESMQIRTGHIFRTFDEFINTPVIAEDPHVEAYRQHLADAAMYGTSYISVNRDGEVFHRTPFTINMNTERINTLNLQSETLIPFKTLGKMRNGEVALFLKQLHSQTYHYHWISRTNPREVFTTTAGGIFEEYCDSNEDIISLLHLWTPAVGDIAKCKGFVKKEHNPVVYKTGGTFDYKVIEVLGNGEYMIQSLDDSVKYICMRLNLKFVRRSTI